MIYNRGPRQDPCGTPQSTEQLSERAPGIETIQTEIQTEFPNEKCAFHFLGFTSSRPFGLDREATKVIKDGLAMFQCGACGFWRLILLFFCLRNVLVISSSNIRFL